MNENVNKNNVDYNKVYEYNDLSMFSLFDRNRQISKQHVKALKKEMLSNGTKDLPPIIIDVNTHITVDGQHREIAYSELRSENKISDCLKVLYIDAPTDIDELLKLIVKLNVKNKHWALSDFVHAGNIEGSSISKLNNFCNNVERPLLHRKDKKGNMTPNHRYGMAITIGKNDTKTIKEETTVNISDEDFENGAQYYDEAVKVIDALGLSNRLNTWVEAFFQAWHDIRKDPAYSEILDRLGIDSFCSSLNPSDFTTTNKGQWESIFKSLLWNANSRL